MGNLISYDEIFIAAPGSAPRDLTPVAVEGKPTWITLNWQPPRQPNGQIIGMYHHNNTNNQANLGESTSITYRVHPNVKHSYIAQVYLTSTDEV